jgi:hypothetical protein
MSRLPETSPRDAFYDRTEPGVFVPTQAVVGPWDQGLQHGGPPAALLGSLLESSLSREGTRIAQFSLEFLGPLKVLPMAITTSVVRPGKKIELLSATASIDGRPALRASAWRVAVSPGRAPPVRQGDAPPARPADAATELFAGVPWFGYGAALEWRFALGGFRELGPATVWSRLLVDIERGVAPTGLARVLAMVDSANGVSAELDVSRYLFVPVNLTVSLTRAVKGEWAGMQAVTSIASDGVGTTRAQLFDDDGFFGEALQTLFVEPR